MAELKITRAAFASIYAASDSLIVDADLERVVTGLVPETITLFLLDSNGVISLAGEKAAKSPKTSHLIGMPTGVMGVIAAPAKMGMVASFLEHAERHKPHVLPSVLTVAGFGRKRKILTFLTDLFADQLVRDRQNLAATQGQLAALRTSFQKQSLALDKSARMMRGVGLGTHTVVFDLPKGAGSVGPSDSEDTAGYTYSQSLPVDIVGIVGLELYVSSVEKGEGNLIVAIRGAASKKVAACFMVSYDYFAVGWHHFALEEPVSHMIGGAEVCILWQPSEKSSHAGPRFSRADETADRFGDENHRSLALRIETGCMAPRLTPTADDVICDSLAYTPIMASDIFAKGGFLGGHALEVEGNSRRGWPVLSVDTHEGSWLQTHPLADGLAAFHVARGIAPHAREIEASVGLEHKKAAPCIAVLAAVDPSSEGDAKIHDIITRIGKEGGPGFAGEQDGITWCAAPLVAMEKTRLRIRFEAPLSEAYDLILAAIPVFDHDQSFGWCRWRELSFGYQLPETTASTGAVPTLVPQAAPSVRVHSFTDIADRIVFYRGRYVHDQLRMKLGFLPIQMLDDVGAMQTNPLEDRLCAALLDGGVPEDATRVACEVGTAHASARRFSYVLGVMPQDTKDMEHLIESVGQQVSDRQFFGRTDTAAWASVTVSAMTKHRVLLELPNWVRQGDIVFFFAIPADGNREFGWCRWYSLTIETRHSADPKSLSIEVTGAAREEATRKLA